MAEVLVDFLDSQIIIGHGFKLAAIHDVLTLGCILRGFTASRTRMSYRLLQQLPPLVPRDLSVPPLPPQVRDFFD